MECFNNNVSFDKTTKLQIFYIQVWLFRFYAYVFHKGPIRVLVFILVEMWQISSVE